METISEQGVTEAQAEEIAASYDYGRAGHLTNDQMRAIGLVHDQFARTLSLSLEAWLRTSMHIAGAAGEQMSYANFLSRVPDPCYVCVLRLEPLGGVGLVELDLTVAMTMIDLLLGGKGEAHSVREVSEIEEAILASMLEVVLKELNAAWESAGLRFMLQKHEAQSRLVRLMPPGEQTLCFGLDLQMTGAQGRLSFCLPTVVLNTIHRRMSAQAEQPRKRIAATFERVEQLMAGVAFQTTVRLPVVRLASREIRSLQVGQVVELALPSNTMAEMLIEGVRFCSVLPVAKGDRCGALLQEDAMGVVDVKTEITESGEVAA